MISFAACDEMHKKVMMEQSYLCTAQSVSMLLFSSYFSADSSKSPPVSLLKK